MHVQKMGLSADVNIDWGIGAFDDGSASDGFHVFVGAPPCPFRVPVHVPSNMDIRIALAQPRWVEEITGCRATSDIPKLRYFDHYDPYGILCVGNAFVEIMLPTYGCQIPILSYIPENDSCSLNEI